jgi:hypothetical protein
MSQDANTYLSGQIVVFTPREPCHRYGDRRCPAEKKVRPCFDWPGTKFLSRWNDDRIKEQQRDDRCFAMVGSPGFGLFDRNETCIWNAVRDQQHRKWPLSPCGGEILLAEERLPPTFSHRRKMRRTHIDQLVEWRCTSRTIASGRRRTPTGVVKIEHDRTRPMTRNGPTNEHCGNHDDDHDDKKETPLNDDDKEMAGGRCSVE